MNALRLAGFVAGLAVQAAWAAPEDSRSVQATGCSSLADPAAAREAAVRDAIRNAVEKAVGVYVESRTRAEADDVLADRIFTRSSGYVHHYVVTDEKRRPDGLYEVTIAAQVSEKKLLDDVEVLLAEKGRPRLGVLVEETIDGAPAPARPVYSRLCRYLETKGYELVSTEYLIVQTAAADKADDLTNNPLKAARLAQQAGIDVLVLCRAAATAAGQLKTYADIVLPQYLAQVNAQAVRTSNGAVLVTEAVTFDPDKERRAVRLGKTSAGQAAAQALELAADRLLPVLNLRILQKWSREMAEGTRIELVVKGLGFDDRLKFRRALEGLPGVRHVTEGRYADREARLDVYTILTAEQLAAAMREKIGRPALAVESLADGRLVLRAD